ncbi:hypothetical protein [Paenibacillus glucanolyticus]|uniref:hypothetical protein n=1 Tax=Paenibacillus glucanolyticus TaxID=59843 RepID=UPI00096BE070|nr:hypothetical protein [Paenibacillus glucanolyticus]OMF76760.1 hypothetical protein BK142_14670 [Paenibacillus glucanolyticus]
MNNNKMKLTRYDDEKIASEFSDDETPFYVQDLEGENTIDATTWLEKGVMVGIVSEVHGGIIGYVHSEHASDITTILNLHAVERSITT